MPEAWLGATTCQGPLVLALLLAAARPVWTVGYGAWERGLFRGSGMEVESACASVNVTRDRPSLPTYACMQVGQSPGPLPACLTRQVGEGPGCILHAQPLRKACQARIRMVKDHVKAKVYEFVCVPRKLHTPCDCLLLRLCDPCLLP